uniref:Uncharacterized protein n=1 Tax=Anas platyrhynchos TaxID=8839 RepID=A0A8B9TSV8_ANAPL
MGAGGGGRRLREGRREGGRDGGRLASTGRRPPQHGPAPGKAGRREHGLGGPRGDAEDIGDMPGAAVPKLAVAQAAAGTALREPGAKEDNGAVQGPGSKELRSCGWGVAVSRSNTSRSRSSPSLDPGDRGEEPAHMAEQPAPELAPVHPGDGQWMAPKPLSPGPPAEAPIPQPQHGALEEGRAPQLLSRRSSILSTLPAPLASRRSSLGAAPGGKRPSIGPWMLHSRVSFSGLPLFQPIPEIRLENTYRMGPDEGCGFNAGQGAAGAGEGPGGGSGGHVLQPPGQLPRWCTAWPSCCRAGRRRWCRPATNWCATCCWASTGQQSLLVASRALWDPQSDNFASATFSNCLPLCCGHSARGLF